MFFFFKKRCRSTQEWLSPVANARSAVSLHLSAWFFTHLLLHKYFLTSDCMPGFAVGVGDIEMNKTRLMKVVNQ